MLKQLDVENKLRKLIDEYSKKYDTVEYRDRSEFLAKFQREVLILLRKDYKELSSEIQNKLGHPWILMDILKYHPEDREEWVKTIIKERET